jgi:hypothetical protein
VRPGSGSGSGSSGGGTVVEGGTTTTVGWNWGAKSVLNFNPAKDKLDFVWMQPGNFEVTSQADSVVITITGSNNQTYTLQGVTLSNLQLGNIVAKDPATLAKWSTLISNAAKT